ncbi:unnamed protein product [Sphagnum troendelagicum]
MAAAVASQAVAAMASVAGIAVSLASSSSSQVARLQLTTPAAPSSFGIGRCRLITRSSATSDFGSTAPKKHAVSKVPTNAIATKEAGASSATTTGGHELLLFQVLRRGLEEELDRDPTVCVIGENVGHYGVSYKVTKGFAEKFGDWRLLDTPICENSFTGIAIGASMTGLWPVIEGDLEGWQAIGAEHSQRLESYFQSVPGLQMVACSTPYDAKGLMKAAICR